MFSKSNKPTPRPAGKPVGPPPLDPALIRGKSPTVASVIGKDMTVEGGMTGEGELQVDGMVRGDIKVNRLTIGETGQVEGTVSAELAEIRGKIVGSVTAKQIRLFATAHVDGDITHEQLAMETGASFQGRSLKFQRQQSQPSSPAAPKGDVVSLSAGGN
jgi:cytoskeletal protein CcmA (bactofilin family)